KGRGMTNQEELKARKFRRLFVYSLTAILFIFGFIGLLYGMRPMIVPFILGAFLAYVLKPLVSYRGSKVKKYLRAGVLLSGTGVLIYGGINLVKQSIPNEREKLILKVRMQYRLNDRYQGWMGLKDGGK